MAIVSERAMTLHNERIGHMDSNLQTVVSQTNEIRLTTQITGKTTEALHEDLVEMSREIRVIRAADEAKGGLIEVLCDRVIELSRRFIHSYVEYSHQFQAESSVMIMHSSAMPSMWLTRCKT